MSPKPILCLLLALFLFTPAFSFEEENNVLVLTSEDFDKAIDSFEYILVEFYAPWCGHCTKLAPEYEKAALALKESGSKIKLAKVDATTNQELAQRLHVQGFPTIFFYTKGESVDYSGARNANGILGWLTRKTQITSQNVAKLEDLDYAIEKLEFVIIFYGDELDRVFKMFWNVASKNMDIAFFHTTSEEIKQRYNPTGETKVSALRSFDERRVDFEDDFTESNLDKFILKYRYPRVMPYSNKVAKLIFGDLNPALLVVKGRGDSTEKAWNVVETVIDEYRSSGIYATVCPFDAEECEKVIKYFGVKKEDVPAVVLFRPASRTSKAERYLFEGKINQENLLKFLEGYKNNELTPLPKSDEVPDKNEDLVKVIVGRSFKDIVHDNEKDVLVFYNDIDCPECRELLPTFQGLAKLTLPIENLILGKIDLENNYVPGLTFKKCPQILLYPRHKKEEPITYTGENDLKALYEFFKDHFTVDFDHSLIQLDETLNQLKREAQEQEEAALKSRKKMEELQAANEAREKAAQQAQEKAVNVEL